MAKVWNVSVCPWAAEAAATFDDRFTRDLAVLDVFFGHGFCLREAWAARWGLDHASCTHWEAFIDVLAELDNSWFAALVSESLRMRFDAHEIAFPEGTESGGSWTDKTRRRALEMLMDSSDYIDDDDVRRSVVRYNEDLQGLQTLLRSVVSRFAEAVEPDANAAIWRRAAESATRLSTMSLPPDPTGFFPLITGSLLPPTDRESLNVSEVLFMCSPHLDGHLSFGRCGDRCYVYFDPAQRVDHQLSSDQLIEQLESPLSALSNPARLKILRLLALRGTLYAQQIVDETEIPQASVANHLATLSSTGLLLTEQRGNRRYYTLVPDAAKNVVESLTRLFFP